jgi:hypothetical protein
LLQEATAGEDTNPQSDMLIVNMSGQPTSVEGTSPGDIRHVLAARQDNDSKKGKTVKVNTESTTPDTLTVGDPTYFLNKGETITFQGNQYFTHSTIICYCIGQHEFTATDMALIERGANGCVCGDYMRVLEGSECFVDVSGLGGHRKNQLCIVTAQALMETQKGNVIAVFHQIAILGKGKSILSCIQMEHYGAEIGLSWMDIKSLLHFAMVLHI